MVPARSSDRVEVESARPREERLGRQCSAQATCPPTRTNGDGSVAGVRRAPALEPSFACRFSLLAPGSRERNGAFAFPAFLPPGHRVGRRNEKGPGEDARAWVTAMLGASGRDGDERGATTVPGPLPGLDTATGGRPQHHRASRVQERRRHCQAHCHFKAAPLHAIRTAGASLSQRRSTPHLNA